MAFLKSELISLRASSLSEMILSTITIRIDRYTRCRVFQTGNILEKNLLRNDRPHKKKNFQEKTNFQNIIKFLLHTMCKVCSEECDNMYAILDDTIYQSMYFGSCINMILMHLKLIKS